MADAEPASPIAAAKVDAILCPLHTPAPSAGEDLLRAIKREFAPVLKARIVFSRHYGTAQRFVTASPEDTVEFPTDHPRRGEQRYEFADRGDGILYGTLVAGA